VFSDTLLITLPRTFTFTFWLWDIKSHLPPPVGPGRHSGEPPLALVERCLAGRMPGVPRLGAGRRVRWMRDVCYLMNGALPVPLVDCFFTMKPLHIIHCSYLPLAAWRCEAKCWHTLLLTWKNAPNTQVPFEDPLEDRLSGHPGRGNV